MVQHKSYKQIMSDMVSMITGTTGASSMTSGANCGSCIGQSGASFPGIFTGAGGIGMGGAGGVSSGITTTISIHIPTPITPEEQAELTALQEEYASSMKQKQINAFKQVPAELRQRIVDSILWTREAVRIETESQEKSARHVELENKQYSSLYGSTGSGTLTFGGGGAGSAGQIMTALGGATTWFSPPPVYTPQGAIITAPRLPNLLSEDDIINAHNEATMEEECLGSK